MVDGRGDPQIVIRTEGSRAVDQERLQQRRAGPDVEAVRAEEFLHQREETRHRRGRHARAGLVTIALVANLERSIHGLQHREVVAHVIRHRQQHHEIEVHHGVRVKIVRHRVIKNTRYQWGRGRAVHPHAVHAGQAGTGNHVNVRRHVQRQVGRRQHVHHGGDGDADRVGRNGQRVKVRAVEGHRQSVVNERRRVRGTIRLLVILVETSIEPGATTSGLKRPNKPSCPMPTLPREE